MAISTGFCRAVAVSSEAALEETARMTRLEGLFPCPESATIVAGLRTAMERGVVDADDRTVLVVTGSGSESIPVLGQPQVRTVTPEDGLNIG